MFAQHARMGCEKAGPVCTCLDFTLLRTYRRYPAWCLLLIFYDTICFFVLVFRFHFCLFHPIFLQHIFAMRWKRCACIGVCSICRHWCRCPQKFLDDARRCFFTGKGATFSGSVLECCRLRVELHRSVRRSLIWRNYLMVGTQSCMIDVV